MRTLRTTLLGAAATTLALAAVACGGDEDSPRTSTPGAVASPTGSPPTPEPTADGANRIRAIIAAMEAGDLVALREFIVFTPMPCAPPADGLGGPPVCREGEAEGTLVNVVSLAQCEGFFAREDELALDALEVGELRFIEAYRAPQQFFPEGDFVLLFGRADPAMGDVGTELILTGDSVSGINFGCGQSPGEMAEFQSLGDPIDLDEIVTGEGDGISAVQAVIDAASGGDVDALRGFVRATPTACVTVVEGIGGPPECRDGEAPATEINVVLVADCEGHMDRVEELTLPFYQDGVEFVDAYGMPDSFSAVEGDTLLVFRGAQPDGEELGIAIVMDGGAITGFYNGCGQTVDELVTGLELGEPIAVDPGT